MNSLGRAQDLRSKRKIEMEKREPKKCCNCGALRGEFGLCPDCQVTSCAFLGLGQDQYPFQLMLLATKMYPLNVRGLRLAMSASFLYRMTSEQFDFEIAELVFGAAV